MKILQLIKYFEPSKGGMESVAKNLVTGLQKINNNLQITVFCNNHLPDNKNRIEHLLGVKVLRIKSFFLKSQPISLFFSGLKREIENSDVVHHHYPFPTMELALLRYRNILKKKKFIITWHANIQNSRWAWIEKFYNPIIIKLLNVADIIIVTSPQLLEYSNVLQSFKDKIEVIPLSFESHEQNILPKTLDNQAPRLLFVGKLRAYKGIKYLLEAVKELDVFLDIVGNGEEEKMIKDYIHSNCLNDKVFLHNDVNDNDLKEFYRNANIFVFPSINEAEAFGVVQLEALSYGLPVINTNLKSGVPYVSLDNITGFTVNPSDSEVLKNAINKLINNKELYSTFSKNALDRIKGFTNEKMVEDYFKVYTSKKH